MILITLNNTANQSFSITIDSVSFTVNLKTAGTLVADITINNVLIVSAMRVLPNKPIIPYAYLSSGNFFILTENEEYPDYEKFNISQSMVYLTADEEAALYV